jgi:hypothetical protein
MTASIASSSAHRSAVDLLDDVIASASVEEAREALSRASRLALAAIETADNAAVLMRQRTARPVLLFFIERVVARHGPDARSRGSPLLGLATACGQPDAVSFLLRAGANPRLADDRGLTALMHAVQTDSDCMRDCLLALLPVSDLLARARSSSDDQAAPRKRNDALSFAVARSEYFDNRLALRLLADATAQAASAEAHESGALAYLQASGSKIFPVADLLADFADPARLAQDVAIAGRARMPRGFALTERASLAKTAGAARAVRSGTSGAASGASERPSANARASSLRL